MSDRFPNQPYRPRDSERYAELADLLGDIAESAPLAPAEPNFGMPESASLESALASVDANFPLRPREVSLPNSKPNAWQGSAPVYGRATAVVTPPQPRSFDAWDLRPTLPSDEQAKQSTENVRIEPEFTPEVLLPEPELLDEAAFQSVLEGLEGDLLDESETGGFAEAVYEELPVEAVQWVEEPVAAIRHESLPVKPAPAFREIDVHVAEAIDPVLDFEAEFDDSIFDEMPVEENTALKVEAIAAVEPRIVSPVDLPEALALAEPEFDDFDLNFDVNEPDPTTSESVAPEFVVAGAGLAATVVGHRAMASRETTALAAELPASFTEPVPSEGSVFQDSFTPYDEVPVTGSLYIPEIIATEPEVAQRNIGFDDYELDEFQPQLQKPAVEVRNSGEPVIHAQVDAAEVHGDLDQFSEADFENVFEEEFNPTNELADLVGSNIDEDPLAPRVRNDEFLPLPPIPPVEPKRFGKGKFLAASALGVLLVGSLAYFMGSGEVVDTGEAPAIVRADNEPVRVAPDNPGGTVVPNQDRVVFNEVGGGNAVPEAAQETLVDGRQEPAIATEPVKAEERVLTGDQSLEPSAESGPAIAPRPVQTVTVRPDGTLVVNEKPEAPAATAQPEVVPEVRPEETPVPSPNDVAAAPASEVPAAVAPIAAEPVAESPVAEAPVAEAPVVAEEKPAETIAAKVPAKKVTVKAVTQKAKAKAPEPEALEAVPSRPADQPVNIVNAEAPAEQPVAAPAAAPSGNYAIQIASQPTEDAAASSLRSLSSKYGAVLGGKDYAIQRAEVPGKGTFYRVRIIAGSKEDASKLCARYKSAGGTCFVTR